MLTRRSVLLGTAAAASLTVAPARPVRAATLGAHFALPAGRTYWLSGTGDRLVVGLHGSNLTAANANTVFWSAGGWQAHAAASGYVLALGEQSTATSLASWNVGGGWPSGPQDDMAYLADLVADATARAGPFLEVFIAGFSAGAALAWRAVVERPDLFAAAGSASGWAPLYPTLPVDCLHYHGTADASVPIRGGAGVEGHVFPPAADEARLTPRGHRVVLYPHAGGHGVPGWAAADLWAYWTVDRLRP